MKLTTAFACLALALPSAVSAISASACLPASRRLCCAIPIPGGSASSVTVLLGLLGNPPLPTGSINLGMIAGAACFRFPVLPGATSCPFGTTPLCCALTASGALGLAGANCQPMTFP